MVLTVSKIHTNLLTVLYIILLIISVLLNQYAAVNVINNGLAPPEIVYTSTKPKCAIHASPLDLIFVLDSSGSLKNQFQDEINVIRRIVQYVTIGESATRVMLIQFSGVQHLEFDFNKFTNREDLLAALDVLRHVSGITRIGGAFEFALAAMTAEKGIRGANVTKILYLLSDGRTHDFPKDSEMADFIRRTIPNINIWAYGTGEYVAMIELLKITKDETKIITNKNLNKLESLFTQWHGTEICETQPVCVKGSDKPLDLALIIDSSESIQPIFDQQISFIVDRVLKNINVHPDAVRLALITFSGQAFVHFKFNNFKFSNNSIVANYINTLRPIKGITSAHLALKTALDMFMDRSLDSQVRPNAQKLILIITDGRSARSSHSIAAELLNQGISILAVSLNYPQQTDENELFVMTNNRAHMFTLRNIQHFEQAFVNFVGFSCPGLTLGPDSTPRVRGATDVTCNANSVTFTVRTQRTMNGLVYAKEFYNSPECRLLADGNSRELKITFTEGNCGLLKVPSEGLDVSCFFAQQILPQETVHLGTRKLFDSQCNYRLHRFGPENCFALDAKVGESLFHKWECDSPPNYQFLVHDCYANSEEKSVQILDNNGCEIDSHFLETPNYSKMSSTALNPLTLSDSLANENTGYGYVFQEISAFKFPGESNMIFNCKISLCDMISGSKCTQMIPPKCKSTATLFSAIDIPKIARQRVQRMIDSNNPNKESSSFGAMAKSGFSLTIDVETRTLNVIENEAIRPLVPVRYCDVRN